ncbi:MAG: hypothetical protein KGS61_14535 [Verrucomicrobia bacterium]|nr:hypothetical protein [Verrucomicrobiota bacterium]
MRKSPNEARQSRGWGLTPGERLRLLAFARTNCAWVQRHGLPFADVLAYHLRQAGFAVRRVQKVPYHDVWHFVLRPAWPMDRLPQPNLRPLFRQILRRASHPVPADCLFVWVKRREVDVVIVLPPDPELGERKPHQPKYGRAIPASRLKHQYPGGLGAA